MLTRENVTTLRAIQKKMKKLERLYDRTPEACSIKRSNVERKMQKLIDKANWIRGRVLQGPAVDTPVS